MSITFSPQIPEGYTYTHEVSCWDCGRVFFSGLTWEDAQAMVGATECHCGPYAQVGTSVDNWPEHPEVNMSNSNARGVIERLGLEFDYCGSIDPDDLLGRAMVANVGRDDSGVRDVADGNFIDCGLPAGYYADRMAQLVDVALYARDNGLMVQWA